MQAEAVNKPTSHFNFWQKWLLVIGVLLAVFGIDMVLFRNSPVFNSLFGQQINSIFWPVGEVTAATLSFQGWVYGILGATVAGWGICLAFIAHVPFRRREMWAWNCLALTLTVWYVLDTAVSLIHGVTFNAVFNTIVFVLMVLPLIFTRKAFTL